MPFIVSIYIYKQIFIYFFKALLKSIHPIPRKLSMAEGSPATEWPLSSRFVGSLPPAPRQGACNNDTSIAQMSSGGFGFERHGCLFRRTCGGVSALIYMICLKSLQVLEFLLKSGS